MDYVGRQRRTSAFYLHTEEVTSSNLVSPVKLQYYTMLHSRSRDSVEFREVLDGLEEQITCELKG
jgi:hypothetical protein